MGIGNIMASKISAVEKAKRLSQMAEQFKGLKLEMSAEDIEKAYEESNNLKEVDCIVHISSCVVTLGKMDTMKNDELSTSEREFIEVSSNASKYQMFPVEHKKLLSLETKIHTVKNQLSLSGSNLMTKENFEKKFLPIIKKTEDEMIEIKNLILDTFDDRFESFSNQIKNIVKKIDPSKMDSVKTQLDFIQKRGAEGYISRIGVELRTGYDSEDIKKVELGKFLDEMKKSASTKFAGRVINSFFDDLWNGVITYLTNISSEKYDDSYTLDGFRAVKEKLKNCAITVRANTTPIGASVPDIVDLTRRVERLTFENDKMNALDEGIDTLIAISYIARENYAIMMTVPEKTKGKGIVPSWIKQKEIDDAVDAMVASSSTS